MEENKRFLYNFFIFINNLKKFIELNKSEICTLTLYSREVTKKKLIVTQSWYNSIERFFQFHTLLFLEMDYSYLILKQLHARTIQTQIWSKFIKQLLRYCHFHVLHYFSNVVQQMVAILES